MLMIVKLNHWKNDIFCSEFSSSVWLTVCPLLIPFLSTLDFLIIQQVQFNIKSTLFTGKLFIHVPTSFSSEKNAYLRKKKKRMKTSLSKTIQIFLKLMFNAKSQLCCRLEKLSIYILDHFFGIIHPGPSPFRKQFRWPFHRPFQRPFKSRFP